MTAPPRATSPLLVTLHIAALDKTVRVLRLIAGITALNGPLKLICDKLAQVIKVGPVQDREHTHLCMMHNSLQAHPDCHTLLLLQYVLLSVHCNFVCHHHASSLRHLSKRSDCHDDV
jgi:hypothetical protein